MEWITDRLPTEEDADEQNEVVVPNPGSTPNYGYMYWWEVTGEWLPTGVFQQTRKYGEQSIRVTGSRWITTRQPIASDGNKNGAVHVRKYPDKNWGVNIHWSYVGTGVPWEHANDFEGLIEPIPPENPESEFGNLKTQNSNFEFGAAASADMPMFVPEDVIASIRVEEPILHDGTDDGPLDDVPHRVRTFASVRRTYIGQNCIIDAVASDGTLWCFTDCGGKEPQWTQLPNLPQD